MADASFTFRVDETLKAEFADVARERDRTAAQLIRDFMRSVVDRRPVADDYDLWFHGQVAAAGSFPMRKSKQSLPTAALSLRPNWRGKCELGWGCGGRLASGSTCHL